MNLFIFALRLILLVFSFYGYVQWVSQRLKVEFSIGVVFCSFGSILFFAGILNILKEATLVLYLTGLVLAVYSVWKKFKIRSIFCAGTVFFVVLCIYFFFLLRGAIFLHNDNFSHWAISTKVLLRENRFPNFSDVNIMFKSYPLGFSAFIYYITTCLGVRTEWMQMYAQSILMIGVISGLFAFARTVPQKILTAAGCLMLLASNTSFTDLLVDTLLPVVAVGAIAFCIYYRDSLWDKVFWLMPYTAFLVSVKNSGMFFAVVVVIYLLTKVRSIRHLKLWVWSTLCPLATLLLWQKHVRLVFDNGMMSYHSMSSDYINKMFGSKTTEDITNIFHAFCKSTFTVKNEVLYVLPLLALIFIVFWIRGKKSHGCELALLTLGSYVTYMIMLFCVYLFTMPVQEALRVAEYFRYHNTIITYLSGILLIVAIQSLDMLPKGRNLWKPAVALVCAALMYYALTPEVKYYRKQDPSTNVRSGFRQELDGLIEEYQLKENKKYYVIIDSNFKMRAFVNYLTRYTLDPSKIAVEYVADVIEKESPMKGYDYLIAFTTGEEVRAYLASEFGADADQRVIPLSNNK